jgi:DNA-binding NtrC family response regulator
MRAAKTPAHIALAEEPGLKRSIFYLDDEAGCLEVFHETFAGEYEVRTAIKLAEARRMLAERPADIVISDQSMPETSGTEFLCEVAALYPPSYRVMLTGSMTVGEALPEIGSGIVHLFIAKPWKEPGMRAMLERAALHCDLRRFE